MASDPITVLHLSDVQFGRHHRFASDESFDTLCQRLEDDLRGLAEDHDLRPNLVVVTGDLAEWVARSSRRKLPLTAGTSDLQ